MNFAIIGATGNVGRTTIQVLEKSKIEIDNLYLVASEKSAGQKLVFKKPGTAYLGVAGVPGREAEQSGDALFGEGCRN